MNADIPMQPQTHSVDASAACKMQCRDQPNQNRDVISNFDCAMLWCLRRVGQRESSYCKMDIFVPYIDMMTDRRPHFADFLIQLQASGRLTFTREEAQVALHLTDAGFLKAAARMREKKMLLNPSKGFYVAVPARFLTWGAPPPAWYIDDLMRHGNRPYYVGLLKAAELHGATHQAVMEFQVVTDRQLPRIRAGRSIISYYFRKDLKPVLWAVENRKTETGGMNVSSVELTALDLIRYIRAAGGIDAVATILDDLGEILDGERLAAISVHFECATIQRLGYMLDHLGYQVAAKPLHHQLFERNRVFWIKLEPARGERKIIVGKTYVEKNERWRVSVDRHPEVDE